MLAAGMGTRLRPLTEKIPKAMVKLKGKPLLERICRNLADAGIEEIIIVTGYRRAAIEQHFGSSFMGIPIKYVFQEEQLGTAHALGLAEKHVKGHFLALNSDVIVGLGLLKRLAAVDEFDFHDAVIVGREVSDPWRYGVLIVEGDKIKGIVEKPAPGEEPSKIINAGIYRFNEKIFAAIKMTPLSPRGEYELVDSIRLLIATGAKVRAEIYAGVCIDISDETDLRRAEKLITE